MARKAAETMERTYAAALRGGYSRYHLIPRGTERALCGKIPTWDGWTYVGDIIDEAVERFGADAILCRTCHKGR